MYSSSFAGRHSATENATALVFADMNQFTSHAQSMNRKGCHGNGVSFRPAIQRNVQADATASIYSKATVNPVAVANTNNNLPFSAPASFPISPMRSAGGLLPRANLHSLPQKIAANPNLFQARPNSIGGATGTSLSEFM